MAIKLTKNELKKQKDNLKQFQRYLPTLQLKKQQLQSVIMKIRQELEQKEAERLPHMIAAPKMRLFVTNDVFERLAAHRGRHIYNRTENAEVPRNMWRWEAAAVHTQKWR